MRDRHLPRLCHSCRVPMARQEDTCWRCGTQSAAEDGPRPTLRVIAGGAAAQDAERWMNEGGSTGSETAAQLHVAP